MNNEAHQMHDMGLVHGYQNISVLGLIWNWMTGKRDEFPPDYFLPGQVILHLEHPRGISEAELAQVLADFLSGTPTARMERRTKSSKSRKSKEQSVLREGLRPEVKGPYVQEQPWKDKFEHPDKESIITIPLEDEDG